MELVLSRRVATVLLVKCWVVVSTPGLVVVLNMVEIVVSFTIGVAGGVMLEDIVGMIIVVVLVAGEAMIVLFVVSSTVEGTGVVVFIVVFWSIVPKIFQGLDMSISQSQMFPSLSTNSFKVVLKRFTNLELCLLDLNHEKSAYKESYCLCQNH